MSTDNPYGTPSSDLLDIDFGGPGKERFSLAGRFTRLNAAMVDGIIGLVVAIPMLNLLGIWSYLANRQTPPLRLMLVASVIGFLGFVLIHGYLLKTKGQTVGKLLLGIQIVDRHGEVPAFFALLATRYLPVSLASLVPGIGSYVSLVDCLFIFRSDRRCIHDLIAGTRVVMVKNVE
jgi:uncharacterized RDD family membrane protein YckC